MTTMSFPIGSSVFLQNLVKGSQFNDKKGIVKTKPSAHSGRQEVYVFEAQKSMAIKPANLRYEPRELSSLSISEMKALLRVHAKKLNKSCGDDGESQRNDLSDAAYEQQEWSGMDKHELRERVLNVIGSTNGNDPIKVAELVAEANEPKDINSSFSDSVSVSKMNNNLGTTSQSQSSLSSSQLRQGAERMSQMSPEEIRRQATTMKAMGPAALRAMNPQMALMSDEQINMAITQMELVANDPDQLRMAAEQMKNMSESDLCQAMNLSASGGVSNRAQSSASNVANSSPLFSSSSDTSSSPNASISTNNHDNNISKTQFEYAAQQMSSMSPSQLRQQAAMLRSMSYETLRKTNPPMSHMTDAQIQMSITQLEQMAENPELMKMAADQMKSMTEEQYESMKQIMTGGASSNSINDVPSSTMIMEGLLSNPDQLNSMVRTMKKNPEMLKQVMTSQYGGSRASETQKEQLSRAIDSFAQMDDQKLEQYLSLANGVQRMVKPIVTTLDAVKKRTGWSMRTLIFVTIVVVLASLVMVVNKFWVVVWQKMKQFNNGGALFNEGGEGNIVLSEWSGSPSDTVEADNEF